MHIGCMACFQPASRCLSRCVLRAVVFGKVVEGMAVVKRMEVVGSRAGKRLCYKGSIFHRIIPE